MAQRQRVLVVDGLSETEQVLKAVLEPRGMDVERVRGRCRPLPDRQPVSPHVVVVDEDEDTAGDARHSHAWDCVPRVILRSGELSGSSEARPADGTKCYLQKPFHYGELVQAIERLLERSSGAVAGSVC